MPTCTSGERSEIHHLILSQQHSSHAPIASQQQSSARGIALVTEASAHLGPGCCRGFWCIFSVACYATPLVPRRYWVRSVPCRVFFQVLLWSQWFACSCKFVCDRCMQQRVSEFVAIANRESLVFWVDMAVLSIGGRH
jgi:hypothetical protein